MNIAGVVKDWMLIALSVLLFHSAVTPLNLGGYLIAFGGVCYYNYKKIQAMQAKQAQAAAAKAANVEAPLLAGRASPRKGAAV